MKKQYCQEEIERMETQNAAWQAMTEEERTAEMVEFMKAELRRENPAD
jgi:uncharacterized protein (DUF305 family)